MNLAPIALFSYKRLDTLKEAIAALQQNELAAQSDLYIFSDGPKAEKDESGVNAVRGYVKGVNGFKTVNIIEAQKNKGLANSIISGVTDIVNKNGKIIVVEDDLLVSTNFLAYMNQALDHFEQDPSVFSVSGFSPGIKIPESYTYDAYFTLRTTSWGWGTWANRWDKINWSIEDFLEYFKDKSTISKFNKMGSNLYSLLKKQYSKTIDSWAIRFCYHQFKVQQYSVYPTISKVGNIGFGNDATHTKTKQAHFVTPVDTENKLSFRFPDKAFEDKAIIKRFAFHYSTLSKILSKVKSLYR